MMGEAQLITADPKWPSKIHNGIAKSIMASKSHNNSLLNSIMAWLRLN